MKASELLTFPESLNLFAEYFPADAEPWAWIPQIQKALAAFDWASAESHDNIPAGVHISGDVYIHPSVKLPAHAVIEGPCWIGPETQIRPGAYIRGKVIVGQGCVLGNSCEFKNCLVLDGAQIPHFNYVGDSILGKKAHLGAGVILANLRLDQLSVPVKLPDRVVDSGLRKFGAIFGDHSEAGCNSVIQPGTVLCRKSIVMPSLPFGGYLAENKIVYGKLETRVIDRKF
ncbi:MAG: UDP-N-acetylglucosamine diphosphorylase [Verrucomicrobiota bacterium]